MKLSPARRALAALAAFAIAGAVITPLAFDAQPAEAATYTAPFVGTESIGGSWSKNELKRMFVGQPYSDELWGNHSVTSVEIADGSLPPGLSLGHGTNSPDISVSGTPLSAGDFTFSIRSSSDDLSYQSYITFNVSVLPAPTTTSLFTDVTLGAALVAGSTSSYAVKYRTTGSAVALTPTVSLSLPTGVTITNLTQLATDWSCTQTSALMSCRSLIDRPLATTITVFTVTVAVNAALYGSATVTATAQAGNAASATKNLTSAVTTTVPVITLPAQVQYADVPITVYAPGGQTGGTMNFFYTGGGGADTLFDSVGLGSANSLTYSATLPASTSGANITIRAAYVPSAGPTISSASVGTYAYQQSTMAGTFYLNGAPYTGPVDFNLYSDAGSSGAFLKYSFPGSSDGSYSYAPSSGFGHQYYSWAELPEYGGAMTFYNAANVPTTDSGDRTTISDANFSDSMNYYWELAAAFTDTTMAVPRFDVAFTDGVAATSNVAIAYSVSSGALPGGLVLNSTSGAITGTATTVGEVYSFVIKADNGVLDAFTPAIEGTVLPTHIVPTFTDSTLPSFRQGTAVVDGVAATGDGPIAYSISVGALPTGLALNPGSGAVTGTPTIANESYAFTITAASTWGSDEAEFSGTVPPALAAPLWIDSAIGELRVGETLSDAVSASGEPVPSYSIIGKPSWLTLDATTGAISGSPAAEDSYDFTITATNSLGHVDQRFTGTVEPAWIPPTFTDDAIEQLQGGVYLDDQVEADGDGTIVYSTSLGDLPAWLTLTSSGLISGTAPLSEVGSPYSFTVTATSPHGSDSATLSGVVAAAPTGALVPGFVIGDIAAGAPFTYEVTGMGPATPFSVTVNSTPVIVASGPTSGLGAASGAAALPAGIAAGAHSIMLLGFASDGTSRTTTVWFTVLADGTIGAISLLGPLSFTPAALGNTGSDVTPLAAFALLLLLAGFVVRRRSQQA